MKVTPPPPLHADWEQRSRINRVLSVLALAGLVAACAWGLLRFPGL